MIARFPIPCKIFMLILLQAFPITSLANATEPDQGQQKQTPQISTPQASTPTLPTVTVEATRLAPLTGSSTFNQEQIKNIPSRNSNTSDLLKLMPGVQSSETTDSSLTAGEISPAAVSISGGRPYDNNFIIDGVGNNSLLDPEFDNPSNVNNVPGHSQEVFLLNNLVQEISVLRSNISARYGGFTGGVIDVKTIDPAATFSGSLSYRATTSDWTNFHINSNNQDDFSNSISEDNQPNFFKQNATLTLNTPINDHSGMLFSYAILDSDIPLNNLGIRTSQSRRTENFFIKYKNDLSADTSLTLSGLYAPYEGDYFLKNTKGSDYSITGGGYTLTGKLEHSSNLGDSDMTLAFKSSQNSRRGPDNWYNWTNVGVKNWGPNAFSKEGGYGNIDKDQQTITSNLNHLFSDLRLAKSVHKITAGVEAENIWAKNNRITETTRYSAAEPSNVNCNGDNTDCIDGEQFIWFKNIYPEDDAETRMLLLAGYLEDNIAIKRLTLRPGLRISWDDYLHNTDIAPRFSAGLDLFGTGQSVLIAGANRYYGKNLLSLKLAEQKTPLITEKRGTITDGVIDTSTATAKSLNPDGTPHEWIDISSQNPTRSRVSDLNTPYSNEWTVGLRQMLFEGLLELDYIDRQGHDLITSKSVKDAATGNRYNEWSNAGRNHHQQVNLGWNRNWSKSNLTLSATWQQTTGNSETYTDRDFNLEEPIMLNGKIASRDELLLENYNRPVRASIIYTVELWQRMHFTNVSTYRSKYKSPEKTGHDNDLDVDIYEDVTNDQSIIFDWHFALDMLKRESTDIILTLDIYNVLDKKTHLGASDTDYEVGRQFWAGAEVHF